MEQFGWTVPWVLALFGLLFGSFANVVIWRLPRGESLVSPGSHCPRCGRPIRWYDNVPVVSWLVLRGRCRDCGEPIKWRYPLVEALSAALWALAGVRFGATAATAAAVVLFYLLLVLTFIDLDTFRLPNPLVGALAVVGLMGAIYSQVSGVVAAPLIGVAREGILSNPLAAAGAGLLLGAGVTSAIAAVYGAARGKTGLGAGDVKLLGAMGIFLGPYVLMALMIGSVLGAVVGIVAARRSGESLAAHKVPFGPYLAAGCVVTVLAGPGLWTAYLRLLGAA